MSAPALLNHLKRLRDNAGLSQQGLADRVGASRQAILAIEAGRQVPSTRLSLLLAQALDCGVEDLFELPPPDGVRARLVEAPPRSGSTRTDPHRVLLGNVRGEWIAHRLDRRLDRPADGVLVHDAASPTSTVVRPLADPKALAANALVAGCAPLLGLLAQPGRRIDPAVGWVQATSGHALSLLARGEVHVAGLHLVNSGNAAAVRRHFPGQRMLLVNLTRWRQGLVLPRGNPMDIHDVQDLMDRGLQIAQRSEGAGATKLLRGLLGAEPPAGPYAQGHADVAQLVSLGAADAGVAIESVALAAGLDFVPLSEERFDLVVPGDLVDHPGVVGLIEALASRPFQLEARHIPGYDQSKAGEVSTVEAA